MANDRRIVTVEYLESEGLNHKQDYFADVSENESTKNLELDLKDAEGNTVGQLVIQKTGGIIITNIATPTQNDYAANKKYVDDQIGNIESILATMFNEVEVTA